MFREGLLVLISGITWKLYSDWKLDQAEKNRNDKWLQIDNVWTGKFKPDFTKILKMLLRYVF